MNIRATLAVLLTLCGVSVLSSAHAADFYCRVYSGTDTWEKATVNQGHYKYSAADKAAAEAGVLKKVAGLKTGVTLTRADCRSGVADFTTTAAAPATTPAPAPAAGGTRFYCMVYEEGTNDQLKAPAGMGEQDVVWWVPAAQYSDAQGAAVALANSKGLKADSAECSTSLKGLMSH
jgi:hypothetical protein